MANLQTIYADDNSQAHDDSKKGTASIDVSFARFKDTSGTTRTNRNMRRGSCSSSTFIFLPTPVKNLDQQNINSAYVSGMKEALHMDGNELAYLSNVFTAGYVISQLPAVILVTKLRPSHVIPTLECLWAIFTFCSAAVTSVPQLYGLRFLIGFCEGAFFPCIIYLRGSWYTKHERAKRTTLFYCTASLAHMFSGYLQAAAYNNLDGVMGHAGWQW
jgi:ACS family pantothenate transporter-like MFS transporter